MRVYGGKMVDDYQEDVIASTKRRNEGVFNG